MAPLAHILAPQIAKRAEEIEAELGYAPAQGGYLQAGAKKKRPTAAEMTGSKDPAPYQPETPHGAYMQGVTSLPAGNAWGAFKHGALSTYGETKHGRQAQPIPNAPVPQPATPVPARRGYLALPSGPIGMTESGMPVQGPNTQPRTVTLPAGTVGMSESGHAVDRKGKKGGFLAQQDPNRRTLERGRGDVVQQDTDAFAQKTLEKMYGEDLQAYEEQGGKFEKGYFDGVDKERAKNIRDGVKELARRKKGVRT